MIRFRAAGRLHRWDHVHPPFLQQSHGTLRRGIGSMAVTDHVDADSVGPDLQLDRSPPRKGIGSHQQRYPPACAAKHFGDRVVLPHRSRPPPG
jgi:hypothetical protein